MLEVAHTVGEMPSRSKCGWFRGSLTRAMIFWHAVLLLGELRDHEVVLVVSGESEHEIRRSLDPGLLEGVELRRVALHRLVLEFGLEPLEPVALLLDDGRLVAVAEQRAHDVRARLAAACNQDIHA